MEKAAFLSTFPDIPFAPEVFLVSIARSGPNTSYSVKKMDSSGTDGGKEKDMKTTLHLLQTCTDAEYSSCFSFHHFSLAG